MHRKSPLIRFGRPEHGSALAGSVSGCAALAALCFALSLAMWAGLPLPAGFSPERAKDAQFELAEVRRHASGRRSRGSLRLDGAGGERMFADESAATVSGLEAIGRAAGSGARLRVRKAPGSDVPELWPDDACLPWDMASLRIRRDAAGDAWICAALGLTALLFVLHCAVLTRRRKSSRCATGHGRRLWI